MSCRAWFLAGIFAAGVRAGFVRQAAQIGEKRVLQKVCGTLLWQLSTKGAPSQTGHVRPFARWYDGDVAIEGALPKGALRYNPGANRVRPDRLKRMRRAVVGQLAT